MSSYSPHLSTSTDRSVRLVGKTRPFGRKLPVRLVGKTRPFGRSLRRNRLIHKGDLLPESEVKENSNFSDVDNPALWINSIFVSASPTFSAPH